MQLYTLLTLLTAATSTIAAPALSIPSATPDWSIENFTRTCNIADTRCLYSFRIETNVGGRRGRTACLYTSRGTRRNPASRAAVDGQKCGAFTVSSSWSDQFGEENGFTTLAVKGDGQIVWPAYADSEVRNGRRVTPNKSYAPQTI